MASSFLRFLDHTQRRTTVGRTPLDEWSACRRDPYLTTRDTHNTQISMPPVGFERTISVGERPQFYYTLDRAATGTGTRDLYLSLFWYKQKTHNLQRTVLNYFFNNYPPIYIQAFQVVSSGFPTKICMHFSSRDPPSRCLCLDHSINIWSQVEIIKFLILTLYLTPCYALFPVSKYYYYNSVFVFSKPV